MKKYPIKDYTYYIVVCFPELNIMGYTLKRKYKTENGACKMAMKLNQQGNDLVMVRKEEVFYQDENTDISSSSPMYYFREQKQHTQREYHDYYGF